MSTTYGTAQTRAISRSILTWTSAASAGGKRLLSQRPCRPLCPAACRARWTATAAWGVAGAERGAGCCPAGGTRRERPPWVGSGRKPRTSVCGASWKSTGQKTGSEWRRRWETHGRTYSACTDGTRFLSLGCTRARGRRTKTRWYGTRCSSLGWGTSSGAPSPRGFPGASASSAASAGSTTWTPPSREASGPRRRSASCSRLSACAGTAGPRSPNSCPAAPRTR
mmetsp:Transcript_31444/g.63879  ORF Transcript_31444/g.63879 Transcript_31444/m.63879 type:complete len:224 (-) Transcript_31444:1184-1855(-)